MEFICEESIPGIFIAGAQQAELFASAASQQSPRTEARPGSAKASSANHATADRIHRINQLVRNVDPKSI